MFRLLSRIRIGAIAAVCILLLGVWGTFTFHRNRINALQDEVVVADNARLAAERDRDNYKNEIALERLYTTKAQKGAEQMAARYRRARSDLRKMETDNIEVSKFNSINIPDELYNRLRRSQPDGSRNASDDDT